MTDPGKGSQPASKRKKPWYRRSTTVIAFGALIISLASVAVSAYLTTRANSIALQEETVSEQQELVSLVTAIAQEPGTIAQETAAAKANSASSPVAVVGTQLTDLADSEEAAYLLQALPGNGATAVEYYYTAVGLEAGENAGQALGLLQKAATLQPDPRTHANILRAEAQIFYDLHKYGPAEGDITLAEEAFSLQNPDETSEDYWNNKAFTELFDVQYRVQIDCQTALNEYSDGVKLVNTLSGDTAVFTSLEKSDRTALITRHLPAAPIPPVDAGRYCRT